MKGREREHERGQATIEFAIVLPFLLLLVVGLIEFGITFNSWLNLNDVASSGARFAAVGGGFGSSAGSSVIPSSTGTQLYGSATSGLAMTTTSTNGNFTFSAPWAVTDLAFTLSTANSGGNTLTVTVMRNGSATSISCTVPTGSTSCTSSNSVNYGSGDTINIRTTRSSGGVPAGTVSGSWTLDLPMGYVIKDYIKSKILTGGLRNDITGPNGYIKLCLPSATAVVGDPVTAKVGVNPYAIFNLTPGFRLMNVNLSGSSTMRLERAPSGTAPANGWDVC